MTCEWCETVNKADAKQCTGCGRSRAEMDWLAQSIKEAEEEYREYLTREPGDY